MDQKYGGLQTAIVGPETPPPQGTPFKAPETASQIKSEKDKQLQDFAQEQALEVQIANNTAQSKIAAAQNVFNESVRLFGNQSREAEHAAAAELAARRSYVDQLRQQDATEIQNIAANSIAALNLQKGTLAQQLAEHQITKAQEIAAEQQYLTQENAIRMPEFDRLSCSSTQTTRSSTTGSCRRRFRPIFATLSRHKR